MKLHGPQQDRDRSIRQSANKSLSVSRTITLERELESNAIEAEIIRLRADNTLMKEQLARSLNIIKLYQIKFPSAYIDIPEEDDDEYGDNHNLPPWGMTADVFLPLFNAYDIRIKELEDIINLKAQELNRFQSIMSDLVAENEELREIQIQQLHATHQYGHGHGGNAAPMDAVSIIHSELVMELNERIDILMAENGLLTEQKSILTNELDKHHIDLTNATNEIKSLHANVSKLHQEVKNKDRFMEQLENDRNEAANQAIRYSEQFSKLEHQIYQLTEQNAVSKTTEENLLKSLTRLQQNSEGMVKSHDDEIHAIMKKIKVFEDRIDELNQKNLDLTSQRDALQDKYRRLTNEYKSVRDDAESMLTVMQGLESQLSTLTNRENEVKSLATESKLKVIEAINQRDQAIQKEKNLANELNRLIEENKNRSKEKYEAIEYEVSLVKQKAMDQLKHAEIEMHKMGDTIATLRSENDFLSKEHKISLENIERLRKHLHDEKIAFNGHTQQLQVRLDELVKEKDLEYKRKVDIQEVNKELRLSMDKLQYQYDTIKNQLQQHSKQQKLDTTSGKLLSHNLEKELQEKQLQYEKLYQDYQMMKSSHEDEIHGLQEKLQEELKIYRQRVHEADKMVKELENNMALVTNNTQHTLSKMKESHQYNMNQLEGQLQQVREKHHAAIMKLNDRDQQIVELMEENKQLLIVLEEAENAVSQLEGDLYEANEKIQILTDKIIVDAEDDDDDNSADGLQPIFTDF